MAGGWRHGWGPRRQRLRVLMEAPQRRAVGEIGVAVGRFDIAKEAALKKIEEKVEQEVLDAVEFADNSDFPKAEELYEDMFVEENPYFHT